MLCSVLPSLISWQAFVQVKYDSASSFVLQIPWLHFVNSPKNWSHELLFKIRGDWWRSVQELFLIHSGMGRVASFALS